MVKLERSPFVGDEQFLNYDLPRTKQPHLKIKVKHGPEVYTGTLVEIDSIPYQITSVSCAMVQPGHCFIRVKYVDRKLRPRIKCSDVSTSAILARIEAGGDGLVWNVRQFSDLCSIQKVLTRKFEKLEARGYIEICGYTSITEKGRQRLQQLKDAHA
jgi:hypothetical protein